MSVPLPPPIATPDFGTDYECVDDLTEDVDLVSGLDLVKQDVYHRLITEALLNVDDFGIDVTGFLGKGYTPDTIQELAPLIDSVVQRDKRVQTSDTTLTITSGEDEAEEMITITINIQTALGPFDMVVQVSALGAELL